MNILFKTISGSHLYGTNDENSDLDIRGFCESPINSLLGLDHFEQYNDKTKDVTIYYLNKFVKLAYGGNPNILELLWANTNPIAIINNSQIAQELFAMRQDFICGNIFNKFYGFITSELTRIERKSLGNLQNKRRVIVEQYGYDTKALMNVARLYYELASLLYFKKITFPLLEREQLKLIKQGEFSIDEIKSDILPKLENIRKGFLELLKNPDYNKINDWLVDANIQIILKDVNNSD